MKGTPMAGKEAPLCIGKQKENRKTQEVET
jgi:hypothetical protein